MTKKKNKLVSVCTALALAMTMTVTMSGCGSASSDAQTSDGTMGRVSGISDSQLTVETLGQRGLGPGAASGSAAAPDGERPDGPPDGQAPSGNADGSDNQGPPDGQAPSGNADGSDNQGPPDGQAPSGNADGSKDSGNGAPDGQGRIGKGESKTYSISSSTAFYREENGSQTEITSADVQPGDMVKVVSDGDNVTAVYVQTKNIGRGGNDSASKRRKGNAN